MTTVSRRRQTTRAPDCRFLWTCGREYRRTLYYIAVVLNRSPSWPLGLWEFASLWLQCAPPNIPVWGVGNHAVILFVHYLNRAGYLKLSGPDHQIKVAPARRMLELIDRIRRRSQRSRRPIAQESEDRENGRPDRSSSPAAVAPEAP